MIARLLLLLAITLPATAADLKVLSWNAFMLPKPIKFSNQKKRTQVITSALEDEHYDFVFFQEAFMSSFRRYVGKNLKDDYPHQYYLKNKGLIYPFFGSGVFVLGRHPFQVLDRVYYNECGKADCFASKGAVLIESKLPNGKVVQFAITHLQAMEKLGQVRLSQMNQIKQMMAKYKKAGVPQFLIGDLNIDVNEVEFQKGLDLMGMKETELNGPISHTNVIDCYKKPGHEKEWIDHMWVDRETPMKDSSIHVRVVEYEHKGKVCAASDHHAIEGTFTFGE